MPQKNEPAEMDFAGAQLAVVRSTLGIVARALFVMVTTSVLVRIVLSKIGIAEGPLREVMEAGFTTVIVLPLLYATTLRPVTELAAKQAAAAAEARFEAIAQAAGDAIVILDMGWKIHFANRAAEKMFGITARAWLNSSLDPFLPEETKRFLQAAREHFLQTGEHTVAAGGTLELELLRRDGSRFPVELRVSELRERQQTRYVAMLRDVTTRKNTEREIQERTTRLNALIANSPLGIVVLDKDQRVQMCNAAFEQLFQYHSAEIAGMDLDGLVAPLERRSEASEMTKQGMHGQAVHSISRRQRKDGSMVDVEIHGVPLLIAGQLEGTYAIYQDISERKRAEAALIEAEETVRKILDAIPLGVRIIRQDGRVAFANPADAQLHGFKEPSELEGMDSTLHIAPEEVSRLQSYAERRAQGKAAPKKYEARRRRRDGTEFQAQMHAERILYKGSAASLLVIEDLTDQNRLKMYEQILPVCCMCGKIRDDDEAAPGEGNWDRLDHYISKHTDAKVSHTFCPPCLEEYRKREGLA